MTMTNLEHGPSSERRAQLRALLHGINAKIGMRDPSWWDVAAEIVNEEIEALARHPSFNDAIEAAANRLVEIASLVERRQMLQPRSIARELRKLSRSLKLPDYRGGEAVSERNSTQKDGSR